MDIVKQEKAIKALEKQITEQTQKIARSQAQQVYAGSAYPDTAYSSYVETEIRKEPENIIEVLEQHIEDTKIKIKKLTKALKLAKKLPYTEGDIVFHKKFGKCIVQDINWQGNSKEEIVFTVRIAHKRDFTFVPSNELIPYTELARSIYE